MVSHPASRRAQSEVLTDEVRLSIAAPSRYGIRVDMKGMVSTKAVQAETRPAGPTQAETAAVVSNDPASVARSPPG
jgi:hypothetical protein